ncbi:MAG TPA: RHS repeat-associated core domain-containing protein, partial [Ktedonobacteraceae bacterium]|nr:RHS repeat-associated core domain-containing protein [Ktedonobacteraceae bacterium]
PTQTASYLSDGEGNRVAMATTVSGTTTTTASIGSIEEVQTTGGSTQTTTYYTVAGKRIAANVNGTFFSFGYDALGSQVVVLNASGNVVGSQLYGPSGNQRYNTGTLPTSIGFTGQRADSVTGLDYYVARYYDPVVGQFLSADTVQGNTEGMNPYAYVSGNPETLADPTGHCGSLFDFGCDIQTAGSWLGNAARAVGSWVGGVASDFGETVGAFFEEWAGPIGWGILAAQIIHAALNPPKLDCGCIQPSQTHAHATSVTYPGGIAVTPQRQEASGGTSKILEKIRVASRATNVSEAGKDNKKRDLTNYGGAYLQLGNVVNGVFVPVQGYISPPLLAYETDYHVEDQAVDWAIAMIKWYNSQPNHLPITAVRLDIYTFQAPCPACSGYYRKSAYAGDIAEHTGITDVDVQIWTSDGNPGGGIVPADY